MSRGGFRGRGRGGPPGLPAFNSRDYMEALQKAHKHGGMLYPPLESRQLAYMSEPSKSEEKTMAFGMEIQEVMGRGYGDMGTPWRIAEERKSVGIEIESYSDRLKPPTPSGPSKLDPAQLHLDESLFPPVLWKEYFEGQAVSEKKGKARKRRKLDSDDEGDKGEEMSSEESVDDDFDFDDEGSEDHQDYDANYFDNGEGDDDSGGEEEEANNGGGNDD